MRAQHKNSLMANTLKTCLVLWARVQVSSTFPQPLLSLISFIMIHLSVRQPSSRCSRQILLPLPHSKRQRGVPRMSCCFSQNSVFHTIRRQSWNSKINVHSFAYKPLTWNHLKRHCSISWNICKELWGFVSLTVSCQCSHKLHLKPPQIQADNI